MNSSLYLRALSLIYIALAVCGALVAMAARTHVQDAGNQLFGLLILTIPCALLALFFFRSAKVISNTSSYFVSLGLLVALYFFIFNGIYFFYTLPKAGIPGSLLAEAKLIITRHWRELAVCAALGLAFWKEFRIAWWLGLGLAIFCMYYFYSPYIPRFIAGEQAIYNEWVMNVLVIMNIEWLLAFIVALLPLSGWALRFFPAKRDSY